jgi:D-inositol-3-phosphate glycosyltransferase
MPAAFGIAGRDRVVARYGWDRISAATEAVYRDVLDRRHRAPGPGATAPARVAGGRR